MSTFHRGQYCVFVLLMPTTKEEIKFVAEFYKVTESRARDMLIYTDVSQRTEHLKAFAAAQAQKTPTQEEIDANARKKHLPIVIKYE